MSVSVMLEVEDAGWNAVPEIEALVNRAIAAADRGCGRHIAGGAEVSVLLCDDEVIRRLNRDWRGKDTPTNVLSFPAPGPLGRRRVLGDIAVAWGTTAREADAEHKPVSDHLTHLLVHGFLHLVGFDHETATDAESMESLETNILAGLGVPDPYRPAARDEEAPE